MELLWGQRTAPRRGPRQTLTLEQVVDAGIAVADADGLEGLSMRRVAEALGVGTMSLYTYVPGKEQLQSLMLDRVLGDLPPAPPGDWRANLEHHARAGWRMAEQHPWVLDVSAARILPGPNAMEVYERILENLSGLGLDAREWIGVKSLVDAYVRGASRARAEALEAPRRSGLTDDEWWAVVEGVLEVGWDPERWPTITQVEAEGAFQPRPEEGESYLAAEARESFELGLQVMLDGVGLLVERARARRKG